MSKNKNMSSGENHREAKALAKTSVVEAVIQKMEKIS